MHEGEGTEPEGWQLQFRPNATWTRRKGAVRVTNDPPFPSQNHREGAMRRKPFENDEVECEVEKINPKIWKLEALFYVALLILTLITLALALVLRESPQF